VTKRAKALALAAAAALGILLLVLVPERGPRPAPPRVSDVQFVYDGDTVEVARFGKVRLIGIDALDAHNEQRAAEQAGRYGMSRRQVRRWAERGAEFARRHLHGRRVAVQPGPEPYDDYGRLLGYLHLVEDGERDFNLLMLEKGLAAAYHRFPHPRLSAYLRAEERAQQRRVGMWAEAGRLP
jgi:endonuclease YncB( thermonuclease family)